MKKSNSRKKTVMETHGVAKSRSILCLLLLSFLLFSSCQDNEPINPDSLSGHEQTDSGIPLRFILVSAQDGQCRLYELVEGDNDFLLYDGDILVPKSELNIIKTFQ